ncbi:hypothetical protein PPACK8108_LOCUS950 [Phakopsora pachyrhizi]|uniref:Uncharacterized protein n=1 Tax=Phakopsora pachyrhizi TaxID=170000 RepID=A0AAV0AHS1_PHAPC|nr:hypothetical protein PPACK8108_LOCUS950 [Phakopsora pachyrhizi]
MEDELKEDPKRVTQGAAILIDQLPRRQDRGIHQNKPLRARLFETMEFRAVENHRKKPSEGDLVSSGIYPLTKRVNPKQDLVLVELSLMIVSPMGIGAVPMSYRQ